MICQTCGGPVSPRDRYCSVCNTPPGQPAVWPGVRTYPVRGVGIAACLAVAATVLAEIAYALWLLGGRAMAERALRTDDPEPLNQAALLDLLFMLPLVPGNLAAIVLVIIWFYRARKNLDAFPGAGPTMAAGWAIGGWFVPFANLVIPCRVMANIARDSLWKISTPPLVGIWWAGWLLYGIGGRYVSASDTEAYEALPQWLSGPADYQAYVDYYNDALVRNLLGAVLAVVAGVALITLIHRISAAQQARIARGAPAPIMPGMTLTAPTPQPRASGTIEV